MALQVRRGTNAERLGITPLVGELIYVTDTKQLYVGDGTTAGGTTTIANTIDSILADPSPQLGGELDLNGNNITGTGNININGTVTASGNINLGDGVGNDLIEINAEIGGDLVPNVSDTNNLGSQTKYWNSAWINQLRVDSQITAERIQADIIADDSTVVFNAATGLIPATQITGTFTGNVTGDLTGNVTGNVTGTLDGDLTGSVFRDDSTTIIDGISGAITTESFISPSDTFRFNSTNVGLTTMQVRSNDQPGLLNLVIESDSDLSASQAASGRVTFSRDDSNGLETTSLIAGSAGYVALCVDNTSAFNIATTYCTWNGTGLGVGTTSPTAGLGLDVRGNAAATGFVQFGSLTTVERDALTAANGMVIYNSTDNKFQGYEGGAWANLI